MLCDHEHCERKTGIELYVHSTQAILTHLAHICDTVPFSVIVAHTVLWLLSQYTVTK